MKPGSRRRLMIFSIVAAFLAVAILVYWLFDPSENFFPKCPVYALTGIQCPGCGAQRAIHALLHGDIAGAWHYNAMLLLVVPMLVIIFAAEFLRERYPRYHAAVTSMTLTWVLLALLAVWMVVRNVWGNC